MQLRDRHHPAAGLIYTHTQHSAIAFDSRIQTAGTSIIDACSYTYIGTKAVILRDGTTLETARSAPA